MSEQETATLKKFNIFRLLFGFVSGLIGIYTSSWLNIIYIGLIYSTIESIFGFNIRSKEQKRILRNLYKGEASKEMEYELAEKIGQINGLAFGLSFFQLITTTIKILIIGIIVYLSVDYFIK
jgi:hypothetical protein